MSDKNENEEIVDKPTEDLLPPGYQDPTKYRVLESGAIQDISTGKLVAHTGKKKYLFDTRSANEWRIIHQRQKLAARVAAQRGVALAVSKGKPSVLKAWTAICKAQAGLAMDVSKGRSSTEAARFVSDAAGISFKDSDLVRPEGEGQALNVVDVRSVYELVDLLKEEQARRQRESAIDVTPESFVAERPWGTKPE